MIFADNLRFPEGPISCADGSVLVVEIEPSTLTRIAADGTKQILARIPGGLNGAAVGPGRKIYMCNNGGFKWLDVSGGLRPAGQSENYETGAIDVYDPATGEVSRLYNSCDGRSLRGPNDIVFAKDGSFWFTDLGKVRPRDMDRGFVYWAKADGSEIREVAGPIITPNGISLSPDEKTLYVAETETGRLLAFDVAAPGELSKRAWPAPGGSRVVYSAGGHTRFDSIAVSSSGNICIAALHAGAVLEVSPEGSLLGKHPFPDMGVTNVCFGGDDMRDVYVTLSHSGRLAKARWHEPGLRLNFQG